MIVRSTGNLYPKLYLITFGNSCHYVLKGKNQSVLFDPGTSAHVSKLGKRLRQIGIDPESITRILITNTSSHRIGGLPYLRNHIPYAKIASTDKIAQLLSDRDFTDEIYEEDYSISKEFFASGDSLPTSRLGYSAGMEVDIIIKEDQILEVDSELSIKVLSTPGYSENSLAYLINPYKSLVIDECTGYLKNIDQISPACNYSIEATLESIKKLSTLSLDSLCLSHFGALKEEKVAEHFSLAQETIVQLTEETEKAWKVGVKTEEILSALKETYYSLNSWDPILKRCLEKSLDQVWEQIS
ncbi:MAG: MBL fold metallo-hydrolase [Bdellovibrionales bacterium]|nr:MBL fold metallo-hydrolase [Bdellovibrionales bacterium]